MTPEGFAALLGGRGAKGTDVAAIIRETLTSALGELPSVAAMSYTGDATNGDFLGFATRAYELFGGGTATMLEQIVRTFEMRADDGDF